MTVVTPIETRGYSTPEVLVSTQWVADNLNNPDVRIVESNEDILLYEQGHIPNAINLPLSQMRDRYAELPMNREIWTYCRVGQRGYFATRFLAQHGYQSRNLAGGYTTYQAFKTSRAES